MKFSYFKAPISNINPLREISIAEYAQIIKGDIWKDKITTLRKNPEEKNRIKTKELDYIIPSGSFTKREKGGLINFSNIICWDLDNVLNINEIKEKLSQDEHVILVHTSPSGNGLKLFAQFEGLTVDNYETNWNFGKDYFIKKCQIPEENFDEQTKDISRACFVSWDPELYFNINSISFQAINENALSKKEKIDLNSEDNKIINLISPFWKEGNRQNLAMFLSGYLRNGGYGSERIKEIIASICKLNKDLDIKERIRAIESTFKKDLKDIKGYSGLEEILPPEKIIELDLPQEKTQLNSTGKIKIDSLLTLLENGVPKIEWAIDKLIPKKGLTIIAGPTSTFKSWAAMQMALSCVTGTPFLDKFESKKANVLYIDEENGNIILLKRFDMLIKGNDLESKKDLFENLKISQYNNLKLDSKDFISNCNSLIEKYGIKVIIFDSVVRGMNGDEDTAKDVRIVHENIKNIFSDKDELAFILLHHTSKSGKGMASIRGSGDWVNMADIVIMPRNTSSKTIQWVIEKNRYVSKEDFPKFRINIESDEFKLKLSFLEDFLMEYPKSREKKVDSCIEELRKIILQKGKEIIKSSYLLKEMENKGYTRSSFYSALGDLVKIKFITGFSRGKYKLNN